MVLASCSVQEAFLVSIRVVMVVMVVATFEAMATSGKVLDPLVLWWLVVVMVAMCLLNSFLVLVY